jgi:peptidoglycan/LPS O-acetylase OafA/YrhL
MSAQPCPEPCLPYAQTAHAQDPAASGVPPSMSGAQGAPERNPDLDGLRGLAALAVAFGHCYEMATGLDLWGTRLSDFHTMSAGRIAARLISTLFPGDAAVMVFFVLSGYVLWHSFHRKNMQFFRDLPGYVAARLYRLLPLTILTALPLGLVGHASAQELVRNMLLLSHGMNGVLWSLQVEMVASAVLFVLWAVCKGSPWKLALGLALTIATLPFNRGNPLVMFLPPFVLGAAIPLLPARVWHSRTLLAGGIMLLLFTNVFLGHGKFDRCLEIGGAVLLVGAVSQGRLPFLHHRVPLFLGAISYPFYLTHVLGLMAAQPLMAGLHLASPYADFAMRAALSIPPTLLLAWALHHLVEVPVQRAAPRLAWPARAVG